MKENATNSHTVLSAQVQHDPARGMGRRQRQRTVRRGVCVRGRTERDVDVQADASGGHAEQVLEERRQDEQHVQQDGLLQARESRSAHTRTTATTGGIADAAAPGR
jgi:hypothetical protein